MVDARFIPVPDSPDLPDLPELVRGVARDLRRHAIRAAEPHGLHPHQLRALRTIAELDSPRPSDVAERLRIAPRSATEVVDALVERGLVERRAHPHDRRATILPLTDEGRRVMAAISGERDRAAEAYFAVLTAADRAELARLLGRLSDEAPGPDRATGPA